MKSIKSLSSLNNYIDGLRKKKKLTLQRAVRIKCFDCSGYSIGEIEKCHIKECPLWEFRSASARKNRRQAQESKT